MQTGSVASRRASAIWRRVGSASAFKIALVCSICSGRALIVGGQHTPRSRSGRTISFSTDHSVPDPLTNVNGFANVPSTLVYASEVRPVSEIQDAVRERYAAKALQMAPRSNAPMSLSCSLSATELDVRQAEWKELDRAALLSREDRAGTVTSTYRASAEVRTQLERLVAARRVAPDGHAYGVDMTDEMLAVARANQAKAGIANATFLKGTIEQIPVPDGAVDVVISNCVINLAADKRAVLREAHRVLRPGGRFAVADMVGLAELPAEVKRSLDQWAGCVAGTISIQEYTSALRDSGFGGIDAEVTREVRLEGVDGAIASAYIRARKQGAGLLPA